MSKPHYRLRADGTTVMVSDGYRNLVANLGTDRDKAYHGAYALNLLDVQSLLATYRGSWLPQALVDIPALDAARNWRAWQAKPDQITALEATEKRLGVREKVRDALRAARLYGGAALLMWDGSGDPELPLNPAAMRKDGLKRLVVLSPLQLAPGEIERDIVSEWFGKPSYYTLSTGSTASQKIHPSRLCVFDGVPVPDSATMSDGWGDSVLLAAMDAIRHADGTAANVASLIFESKIDVIHIPMLMEMLASGQESAIAERLALGMRAKGTNGALILDGGGESPGSAKVRGKEEYEQKSATFSGLDALWDRFMLAVSGASRIPVSRLFGRSAAGMNATGDGDERVYYDHIQAMQELEVQPAMAALDECLIRSALGARPTEIFYSWRPLRQETAKERAEVFKVVSDAARTLAGTGAGELMPIEALSKAVVNRVVEDGSLPGLEAAIEEFGWLDDPDEMDDPLPTAPVPPVENDPLRAEDAAPRTLYVRRDVLNPGEIIAWAKGQGFTDIVPDLHVTVAYSRTPVDWFNVGQSWSDRLDIAAGGPRQMERLGPDGRYIALLITANELVWRNHEIREAGASWDWPDYQPHISIQIGGDIDLGAVVPYRGKIVLGPEIFEEVRD